MIFDPTSVEVTCVTLPKDHCVQVPWKYINVDTVTLSAKTWTKGHWPLDDLWPHICWGHMCDSTQGSLCSSPMGNINVCGYSDQFWKYHIHTTYYILRTTYRMSDRIVSFWTQFRQDKKKTGGSCIGGGGGKVLFLIRKFCFWLESSVFLSLIIWFFLLTKVGRWG